ncbi:chlorophyll a/b-binding protein [Prochlorococcus sp. MIT 1307]|uniref:chlorophyll a/b-binding protein n=1 Tax=Prochlorococcus sp. MIT 1307 TaxID=3096219 RepID=UPI002A76266E|nr:chlorophyll a/b-binding protein [Prochlorococcus sp. MIT 1307]
MTSNNQASPEQKEGLESSTDSSSSPESASPLTSATTQDEPSFGWSAYAERVNGRFAMVGFIAILLVEALSNDSFLHWAGLIQ